jgi:2,4-dichlorophenol 6-monooxygenase
MQQTLADPAGRARVAAAIADQAEHFDMLGLQLGFVYEKGAVVPDGSEPPKVENPVREYRPSGRPGARLPHVWLERDGERLSSLDLVGSAGFTLLTGPDEGDWSEAAGSIQALPVNHVPVGEALGDPDGRFMEAAGIEPGGALLVRPDQHVAWRTRGRPGDPSAALRAALSAVLGEDARPGGAA